MPLKYKRVLLVFTVAALVVLLLTSVISYERLEDFRLAAENSSRFSFEQTVSAADSLSRSLEKSRYAVDGSMCARICSEAYASAAAAEAALATLPFSTQEMEQISGFLNLAGDYAYTLCSEAADQGFSDEQRETLLKMSDRASELSMRLREMQSGLNDGMLTMDTAQPPFQNIGVDGTEKLSASMLGYESELAPIEPLRYNGKYSSREEPVRGELDDGEMRALAAKFAGTDENQLELAYRYDGDSGRVCYTTKDLSVCVSPAGVMSMGSSRLVSESRISMEKAQETAVNYLREMGYDALELVQCSDMGGIASMTFARVADGALCLDECIQLSVALDDGSIYSFSAEDFGLEKIEVQWKISGDEAAEKIPQGLRLDQARKAVVKNPAGENVACYELSCSDGDRSVLIYVDGSSGKQFEIDI